MNGEPQGEFMIDKELVRNILVGTVLVLYLLVFVQEVIASWRAETLPQNETRTYIWTSLGALIGGVAAFYLGVDLPKTVIAAQSQWKPPSIDDLRGIYALVYVAAGLVAAVTCAVKSATSTTLMKTSAATFVGLAVAVVSALLVPTHSPKSNPLKVEATAAALSLSITPLAFREAASAQSGGQSA